MADELIKPGTSLSKNEKYELLIPQVKALIDNNADLIANLANIMAALKEGMGFLWIGVYFVKENKGVKELMLGPFQGPVACTSIGFGKGVCGMCWQRKEIIIVDDVVAFPGHIACSSLSKSEIVLPAFKNNEVVMVLDADSRHLSNFDHTDQLYLQKIVELIEKILP